MFGDDSAASYIAEAIWPAGGCRACAMRTSGNAQHYLRLCFVLAEGGLYVDADDVLLGLREVGRLSSVTAR